MNLITQKDIQQGLRKCPIHKYATQYRSVGNGYVQCERCKGFLQAIDKSDTDFIVRNMPKKGRFTIEKWEKDLPFGKYRVFCDYCKWGCTLQIGKPVYMEFSGYTSPPCPECGKELAIGFDD